MNAMMNVSPAPRRRFRFRGAVAAAAAAVSMAASAGLREVATIQVASMDVMKPQLALLAAKAKFPLLPMLVPQVLAQVDMAGRFEPLSPESEFGFKLLADDSAAPAGGEGKMSFVWAWPLGKGVAGQWRDGNQTSLSEAGRPVWKTKMSAPDPANPQVPKQADAYIAFTADDTWAYVGDTAAAAVAAAKSGAPFSKPLKKGLVAFSIDGENAMSTVAGFLKGSGDSPVKVAGLTVADAGSDPRQFLPEDIDFGDFDRAVPALLGELKSFRAVLGVSKTGLDLRLTFEPRSGSALARPGVSMPRGALKFRGFPPNSMIGVSMVPFEKDGVLGKAWNSFADKSAKKLSAHFAKLSKDSRYADQLRAFMGFAAAFVRVAEQLRASPVKTSALSFSLAEDDKGRKDVRMTAFSADPARAYGLAKPKVKGLMPLKMDESCGVLSVSGTEKGFDGGKQTPPGAAFAAAFPENAQTKEPLFAGFWRFTISSGKPSASGDDDDGDGDEAAPAGGADIKSFGVWAFGWRAKGASTRMIIRIPADDLETMVSLFVTMQASE